MPARLQRRRLWNGFEVPPSLPERPIIRIGSSDGSTGSGADIECDGVRSCNDDCVDARCDPGLELREHLRSDRQYESQVLQRQQRPTSRDVVHLPSTQGFLDILDLRVIDIDVYDAFRCPSSGATPSPVRTTTVATTPPSRRSPPKGRPIIRLQPGRFGGTATLEIACTPFEDPCPEDRMETASWTAATLTLLGAW